MNRKASLALVPALIGILFIGGAFVAALLNVPTVSSMKSFNSCQELRQAFQEAQVQNRGYGMYMLETSLGAPAKAQSNTGVEYSTTNVQVAGVDEADIVKSDGEYIYTLSGGSLVIARAYPADQLEKLSETSLGDLRPQEMFISQDALLVFGYVYSESPVMEAETSIYPYPSMVMEAQLWDVSDRASPELEKSVEFEGNYVSSRKIGDYAYFVVNSYPKYQVLEQGGEIVPLYRERSGQEVDAGTTVAFAPACNCADVGHFEPIDPQMFITLAAISMADPDAEVTSEVIVGSGQNIYASLESLYLAENNYPYWIMAGSPQEQTIVHKFSLDQGSIEYKGKMEAPGRVLNQFSMDEYNGYFRVATTIGHVSRSGAATSTNNVYVFGSDLNMAGSLEDLAPGESIYSARFMGNRGYLVTFKKIDPLFVIDLSNPANPSVLGKLKIPGYSDYLHPYDENHLIGIGKETVEAEQPGSDFAWYQGVKMAMFDVSDVANPRELHKVVIGDRGTDSDALHDHKAFLFDREKNLLIVPILLAEIGGDKETLPPNTYGDFVYQGAYVYELTLENGFNLKGRVTHYESDEEFQKAGYYFMGSRSVRRSLYIGDVLYTLSDKLLKLNGLNSLEELGSIELPGSEDWQGPFR